MADVFISYARGDKEKARALASRLTKQNWSVWWDRNIPPGRSFDEVIEEALDSAKCVIVIWSQESVASEWVRIETREAARRGILVPVMVEDVKLPLEFRSIQATNLAPWKDAASGPEFGILLQTVARQLKESAGLEAEKSSEVTSVQRRRRMGWRAELVGQSHAQRHVRVYLSTESHLVRIVERTAFVTLYVDGAIVRARPFLGFGTGSRKVYFELSDGDQTYPSTLEYGFLELKDDQGAYEDAKAGAIMAAQMYSLGMRSFRIIVDGQTLYSENNTWFK